MKLFYQLRKTYEKYKQKQLMLRSIIINESEFLFFDVLKNFRTFIT